MYRCLMHPHSVCQTDQMLTALSLSTYQHSLNKCMVSALVLNKLVEMLVKLCPLFDTGLEYEYYCHR